MTFIPAEKCAKVAIEGTWDNQKVVSTFWFEFTSEPSSTDLQTIAAFMFTDWWQNIKSMTSNTYTLDQVTATRQQSGSDIQEIYVPASGNVGTGDEFSVPLNCAWCWSLRTGLRGRSYRGRMYQPGVIDDVLVSPGVGDPAILGPLAAAIVAHLIDGLPTGWTYVVASHFANKLPRTLAVLTPIVAVIIDTALDSMRRRLVGRGT
jgi:hypothetical protein